MNKVPALEFLNSIDPAAHDTTVEMQAVCPDLIDAFVGQLYGDVYQRGKLSLRERLFISIGILMSVSNSQPQLASQLHIALKNGITREELMEVAQQVAVFSGFPKAINSMLIVDNFASEVGASG